MLKQLFISVMFLCLNGILQGSTSPNADYPPWLPNPWKPQYQPIYRARIPSSNEREAFSVHCKLYTILALLDIPSGVSQLVSHYLCSDQWKTCASWQASGYPLDDVFYDENLVVSRNRYNVTLYNRYTSKYEQENATGLASTNKRMYDIIAKYSESIPSIAKRYQLPTTALSPNNKFFVIATNVYDNDNDLIKVFNAQTRVDTLLRAFEAPVSNIQCVAISPQGQISFATADRWFILQNHKNTNKLRPSYIYAHRPNIHTLTFSHDGTTVVALRSDSHSVEFRDSQTHEVVNKLRLCPLPHKAGFFPDDKHLFLVYQNGTITLFQQYPHDYTSSKE